MRALFESGRVAELLLAILAVELVALWWWHRRTGTGIPPRRALPFLAAGAAFALALRAALTGAGWAWVALGLAAAGVAHAWDLRSRWLSSRPADADRR